ncbi:antibiotic biosynthesis monooxygenase family protein [Polycladomyces subterraneus]|uniref:Antibiotic biosynthesis monooxygenase n=1 Tax=Polycladomyces subterraneus TaxID=1016997 RepID=A0ABT8IJ51_9BACL|nr:antibiotic biosynthesis monooxygenase [Polycladomyces subterraneus]MDN4592823.1 antibiotic biosynthesis monooxygenase [Polycladomyces subterraneus]
MANAQTPQPPYYAVIFTSLRSDQDAEAYAQMAERMVELAKQQPGFLGVESVRDAEGFGITVSYWDSPESIRRWKAHTEHQIAQEKGKTGWYEQFFTRVCLIEQEYGWKRNQER